MVPPLIMSFSALFRIDSYRKYCTPVPRIMMINLTPLPTVGAAMNKEALTLNMDKLETGEGRRLPE